MAIVSVGILPLSLTSSEDQNRVRKHKIVFVVETDSLEIVT